MSYAVMPYSDYVEICSAIRSKTGSSCVIKSGEAAALISSISGGGKQVSSVNVAVKNNGVLYGDVNNDGIINYEDLQLLEGDEDGNVDVSLINVYAVDLDGDGEAGPLDLLNVASKLATLSSDEVLAKVIIAYTDGTEDATLVPVHIS